MSDGIATLFTATTTPLGSNASYIGSAQVAVGNAALVIGAYADTNCTLYIDFSIDASNWDSSLTYAITANINEVHRVTVTRPYFRMRIINGSSAQSILRTSIMGDEYQVLTSPLNLAVQQDADAIISRTVDSEISITSGLFTGYSIINKFGYNSDIDTGSTPEDIWEGNGLYTGFPDSTVETISVVSTSADDASSGTGARTIRISGLDTDYNVQSETITLNGLTPVNSVGQYRRVHTATISSVGTLGVNQGIITVKHTTTTANIFLAMQIGRNQTNCSAYTVPAGYTAHMRNIHIASESTTANHIQGNIWTRSYQMPFRSRRPFFATSSYRLYDVIYGGLVFTEKSDIILRVAFCSATNVAVNGGYDLILIKN